MSADITKPETWYGLGLGEAAIVGEFGKITRVPGGWLMYTFLYQKLLTTFIPFHDEFNKCELVEIKPGQYRTGCGNKLKDLDHDRFSMPAFCKYCSRKTKLIREDK